MIKIEAKKLHKTFIGFNLAVIYLVLENITRKNIVEKYNLHTTHICQIQFNTNGPEKNYSRCSLCFMLLFLVFYFEIYVDDMFAQRILRFALVYWQ